MLSVKTSYRRDICYRRTILTYWLKSGFFILLAVIAVSTFAQTQQSKSTQPSTLDPIDITATRSERSPAQIPNSITQIMHNPQHNYQPGATLDEFARGTPGVFFQNQFNFAQDVRIAIRGFGARSPFGVRGIQLRLPIR